MRIAICDDDALFLNKTVELIHNWEVKPLDLFVQTFSDGDQLIDVHKKQPFDILLLDIVMPIINGIDTAKEIRTFDKNVKIIFLTTSKEFAIDSYSVKATNYLLKPIDETKLYYVLDEIVSSIEKESKTILIKALYSTFKIKLMDIEYIESNNKHSDVHLIDGRVLQSPTPLYAFEKELENYDYFFKCHRSYMINFYYIDVFNTKDIRMHSNSFIPISRNLRKEFESSYFSVIFKESGDSE